MMEAATTLRDAPAGLAASPPADLSCLCFAIIQHAPLPMIAVEGSGHIVRYANSAFCQLMGKAMGELVGKAFCEMLPEQDACLALLTRVCRTGKPENHTQELQAGAHPVFWSYSLWPVIADDGAVAVIVQVTETEEFHQKTVAMNEALILGSLRQHELTAAAEAANALVHAADVRKDEFLAMLAHELRNPLAPIRSMVEVLKRAGSNSEVLAPALGTIERQVDQMTHLIDDLLDVSRISRDKLTLRPAQIELGAVIRDVVETSSASCEAALQSVSVTLPAQPVHVYGDSVRLAQVFGNLLDNACKFTPAGGRVSLVVARQLDEVAVTISDSGIGMCAELLPTIFEIFTQGDQRLERTYGGLGIGLTLVRRLVTMHGGSVQAFSAGIGLGSQFVVRLPALDSKPEAAAPVVAAPLAMQPRRVLVVDDNRDAATSLSLLLQLAGNETYVAFDGVEAVAAAEQLRPDLVLLDLGMPKLNGYDAARQIRDQPWGKDVTLVAITGWGQEDARSRTAAAGFDGHLVKPIEFQALARLLADFPAARPQADSPA